MGKVANRASCLGEYQPEGKCLGCVLARLCIDTAIDIDRWFDEQAERRRAIEEMEADEDWRFM